MTCINDSVSQYPLAAKLMTGFAAAALLVFATFAPSALADGRHDRIGVGVGFGYYGGYYGAPPVVYGSPYYYPPPVIYGPGVGINLPGVAIGIR